MTTSLLFALSQNLFSDSFTKEPNIFSELWNQNDRYLVNESDAPLLLT